MCGILYFFFETRYIIATVAFPRTVTGKTDNSLFSNTLITVIFIAIVLETMYSL